MAMNEQLKICEFVAVKRSVTNAIDLLKEGLEQYKDGDEIDAASAAQKCSQSLHFVLNDVEQLVEEITRCYVYDARERQDLLSSEEAMQMAQVYLHHAGGLKERRKPVMMLYAYYCALFVLYLGARNVTRPHLRRYYSMLAEVLHKFARLAGALQNDRLQDAAELQVVALVITEYVLGPATRKSVQNRLATTRMYHEAMKVNLKEAAIAKEQGKADLVEESIAAAKTNVRQAKKYGADSCHAARHVYGKVSMARLSAYRLYLGVQMDRYRLERYTDENWDFNVIHETYTELLEALNVSR